MVPGGQNASWYLGIEYVNVYLTGPNRIRFIICDSHTLRLSLCLLGGRRIFFIADLFLGQARIPFLCPLKEICYTKLSLYQSYIAYLCTDRTPFMDATDEFSVIVNMISMEISLMLLKKKSKYPCMLINSTPMNQALELPLFPVFFVHWTQSFML